MSLTWTPHPKGLWARMSPQGADKTSLLWLMHTTPQASQRGADLPWGRRNAAWVSGDQEPRPQTHSKEASLLTGEQDPLPQAPLAPHPGALDSTHPSPHRHYLRQRPCSSKTAIAVFHPPGSRQTPVVPENTFIHLQGIQANETTADHPH